MLTLGVMTIRECVKRLKLTTGIFPSTNTTDVLPSLCEMHCWYLHLHPMRTFALITAYVYSICYVSVSPLWVGNMFNELLPGLRQQYNMEDLEAFV